MRDRVPGAPGQYKAVITAAELQKLQGGKTFAITLSRDDNPVVVGTPYSKAAVLPDALAAMLCPDNDDPTPADAFEALRCMAKKAAIGGDEWSAAGNPITVNMGENRIESVAVHGKTEQFTTTGKNLLQNTATSRTINGVTFEVNADGSVKANGTATGGSANLYINQGVMLPAGSYIVGNCDATGSEKVYIQFANPSIGKYVNVTGAEKQYTIASDAKDFYCAIVVSEGQTVSNRTFYPMMRLASVTDATYEPYTGGKPAPNADYPQPITGVGESGSTSVYVGGKNLFDKSNYVVSQVYVQVYTSVYDYTPNRGVIIPVYPDTTYTVSKVGATVMRVGTSVAYPASGGHITHMAYHATASAAPLTITTGNHDKWMVVQLFTNADVDGEYGTLEANVATLQIEVGDTATEYAPYNGNTYTLPLAAPLYEGDTVESNVLVGGERKCVETHTKKKRVFDGTENWTAQVTQAGDTRFYLGTLGAKPISGRTAIPCSHFGFTDYTEAPGTLFYMDINVFVYPHDTAITTVADWKAYLAAQYAAGTPVTIVYELATPEVYAHDAVEMQNEAGSVTIRGENSVEATLWPNASVQQVEDVGKKLADVEATAKAALPAASAAGFLRIVSFDPETGTLTTAQGVE